MSTVSFLLSIILLLLTFYAPTSAQTPCGTTRDYDYAGTASSVNAAKSLCESRGSSLATIADDNDLATYRTRYIENNIPYTGTWNGDGNTAIGLSDRVTEGSFIWDDGTV